ncbi:RagB/SusD family nutrient uptake outer membrane protein [Flavivirga amylovorans]|uniref:RagB/SusD family nutrient uptake outer membrane protein n=1 Tax=Flavivirga amylovorans TaxID=870486 RepID=A0ABT8X0V8_9FLAO|nr:RagB/SusD family nutrient uptake outer membrane protein [Flavivirga amylovorans]MDO5987581.1 RagB/SusD family nutrient uptake outer membrane protein [Flavivirga amylovorans]
MKNYKFIKSIILSLILLTLCNCSENELIENPPNVIAPISLYKDLAGFENGLNGLYAQWARERSGTSYGDPNNLMIDPSVVGADNMYGNRRAGWSADVANRFDNNTSLNGFSRAFFNWLYDIINASNTLIGASQTAAGGALDDQDRNRIVAEAKLFRAWAYRHLTYSFGDVPLALNNGTQGTPLRDDWTRQSLAEVRSQMLEDLLFAEENLPETSPNPGKLVKGVATHYLAELYLELDAEKAVTKAKSLIDNGPYSLVTQRYGVNANKPGTPFTDMFLDGNSNKAEGNTEALWVMQHEPLTIGGDYNMMRRWYRNRSQDVRVDGRSGTIIFSIENGGRGLGRNGPTRYAMELYEDSDHRGGRFAWRDYEVLNNPDNVPGSRQLGDTIFFDWRNKDEKIRDPYWPSTRKWDYADPNDLSGTTNYNDQVYLRLAETYLVLAEAQLLTGDISGAVLTLNTLRRRSNASDINGDDVDIDFILDERSRELWSEEHRRYSLSRAGKWYERVSQFNKVGGPTATEGRDELLPIPQSVIDVNTVEFPQNPGY